MTFAMGADEIIELLGLEPLPEEGGMWAQVAIDDHSSAIYFLLQPHDFSALHRLPGPEIYHHYAGAAVELTVLHPEGSVTTPVLGCDLPAGERPAIVVPGGTWQGSRTLGAWSLVGTTMAPPFRDEDFELGERDVLVAAYPAAVDRIRALTRSGISDPGD